MFRARQTLARIKLMAPSPPPPPPPLKKQFCTKPNNNNNSKSVIEKIEESDVSKYNEEYRQLQNLDFMTAAKILFTQPPKKKKFGLDFHLVQLFFACMPPLAVYLVAQYARHEMRKMDAELEEKNKKEEEEKAEEELKAIEEKAQSDSELRDMKERLVKLEVAVKEIAVESKKQPRDSAVKNQAQEDGSEKKQLASTGVSKTTTDHNQANQ